MGVPSAVMMALVRVMLHSCPLSSGQERVPFCPLHGVVVQPPHVVLGHLNRILIENSLEGWFMTAFYSVLSPAEGTLHFSNAGHPRPLLWRASTGMIESLHDIAGLPLGLNPRGSYHHARTTIEPGDVLVCYSDGLTEASNERGDLFGRQRLETAIGDAAGRGAERVKSYVLARLDHFLMGKEPQDDMTLVVLQRDA